MAKAKDLTGMRFGRLTVIERGENKGRKATWVCQCDCGNITKPIRSDRLIGGNTQSCGCLQKERTKELWQDEEFRQMQTNKMKKQWQNKEFRQMKSDEMRERWQDEEFKQTKSDKMRELNEKRWQDEEFRQAHSDIMKEVWKDKDFRQTHSDIMKEVWQNEEMKWKMGYKGGITPISMYLRNKNEEWFNKCKQEANYTCQLTGKQGQLHTHHLYAFGLIVVDAHNTYNIKVKPQVKDYTEEELKLLEDYVADWHKDSSNAVVLCEEAHVLFHSLYGKGDNTKEQYEEFKQRCLDGEFGDLF